jgi:hypothetical protein
MKHVLLSISIAALVAGCGGSDHAPPPSTSGSPSINTAALAAVHAAAPPTLAALHAAVPATTLFTSAFAQVAPVPARHGPAAAASAPVFYIDGIGFESLAILPVGPGGANLYVQCAQYPDGRRACENIAPADDLRMFTISVGQAADGTPFTVFTQERVPHTASQSHQWSILIGAFNERFAEVVADLRAGAATVRAPASGSAKAKPSGAKPDEPAPARRAHVANNCTTDDGTPCVIIHGDPPPPAPPGGPTQDSPPPSGGKDDTGDPLPAGGVLKVAWGWCWKEYMLGRANEKDTTACVADAKLTAEQCHKEVGGFAPLTLNGVPLHNG